MPETNENASVQGGPVVLDIGGDIGALLVFLPESFAGTEIEIGLAGEMPFTHTGVHPRGEGENRRQTAVYPELTTGDYQLRHPGDGSVLGPVVHVEGGALAELDLLELAEMVSVETSHSHSHTHPHAHSH
ncbi:MAG: hypothetical protein ABI251_12600 [Mycobacteriaceae bacterium]